MSRKSIPAVSILVPIYNVEKYLRQCLDSVINQTLRNIEIILIDDGSTDESSKIVDEYADRDGRIVVIHKKNSGYGDSMNCGLDKARGEYIGIVESDDWAEPDMFERLYERAKEDGDVDLVKSNFYLYYSSLDKDNPQYREEYGGIWNRDLHRVVNEQNTKFEVFPSDMNLHAICPAEDDKYNWLLTSTPAIWSGLYRRQFLMDNDITFLATPGASYQDTGFVMKSWVMARKVSTIGNAFIHYRQDNEKSSINSTAKMACVVDEYDEIDRYISERDLPEKIQKRINIGRIGVYFWNLDRLSVDLAVEFVDTMSKDFKRIYDSKLLNYYDIDATRMRIINEIINNPNMFKQRLKSQAGAKVSVIVPMYKCEDYLPKCIESLIGQTMKDIEIVLVDDGSPDMTAMIAERYWREDSRIQIISRSNGGRSAARNTGLDFAHAPFLMFCDSDDYFELDMCQKMYDAINRNNSDLAMCGIGMIYQSNYERYRDDYLYYVVKLTGGEHRINEHVLDSIDYSVCNKILRRNLINRWGLRFPEGVAYEDYYFASFYTLMSNMITVVDEKLYNYIRHRGSMMTMTFSGDKRALDHMTIIERLFYDCYKRYGLLDRYSQFFIEQYEIIFNNSRQYAPNTLYDQLYDRTEQFLTQNEEYLNGYNKNISQRITNLLRGLQNRNLKWHAKRAAKRVLNKFSLSYRRQNQIINKLDELSYNLGKQGYNLDTDIQKSLTDINDIKSLISKE